MARLRSRAQATSIGRAESSRRMFPSRNAFQNNPQQEAGNRRSTPECGKPAIPKRGHGWKELFGPGAGRVPRSRRNRLHKLACAEACCPSDRAQSQAKVRCQLFAFPKYSGYSNITTSGHCVRPLFPSKFAQRFEKVQLSATAAAWALPREAAYLGCPEKRESGKHVKRCP